MGTAAPTIALHYEQRRAEATVLYQLVAQQLENFLAEASAEYDRGLPRYVERELRAYLACGIHAHGFLRARCSTCGKELLVAFSCKRRGVCPSCNARRMCAAAAHLTDCVLPDVPVRQWVLSVPFELRLLLAQRAAALSAVGRIFVQEILRWQRAQARAHLSVNLLSRSVQGRAVCFPQRFGGSLNLNVHYHVAVPDGVFSRQQDDADAVAFHQLPVPNSSDLEAIAHGVELRVLRWLRRRRLLGPVGPQETLPDAGQQDDALGACLQGSLGIGELSWLPGAASKAPAGDSFERSLTGSRASRRARSSRGFDIHAAVSVSAHDRDGRERLLRYCARAPLSLERLSVLSDGRVAYRIKNPRGRRTHRFMTPTQFLARLCALIPPPRHPLVRFHGVFAPHSSWRRQVVALVNTSLAAEKPAKANRCPTAETGHPAVTPLVAPQGAVKQVPVVPNDDPARDARIDWATLLKRVHDIDALACPCGGRLRVIALITEPDVAAAILTALHLPASPPPIARARSPDYHDLPD